MSGVTPGGRGWLLAIFLSRVGAFMVYIAYAATLPVLQREWSLSGTAAGSIASAFQVAYAVSLMGCSVLADRVRARRVFLAGNAASALVSIAFAALARDYWSGLCLYTLLAFALGGTYTTGILLVAENVPVERPAGAVAPLLFGPILDWYGVQNAGAWGWAFVSLGVAGLGAVGCVLLLHRIPEAAVLHRGFVVRTRPVTAPAR
jgi:MFS family permease